ncbi:MAG: hypothetical protein EXS03_00260 [Phycisphaerales bacterium]|nr:hypothetical protein [Phycisphaerales bacterium]
MRCIPDELRERVAALAAPHAEMRVRGVGGTADGSIAHLGLGAVHEWLAVDDGETPIPRDLWLVPHGFLVALVWEMFLAHAAHPPSPLGVSHAPGAPDTRVAWIGRRVWPAPRAMLDESGSRALLARSLFIDARPQTCERKHRLWAAEQALACDGVSAVIWDAEGFDMVASRRTQLAAARSRDRPAVLALAVRPWRERATLTAAASRWAVHPCAGVCDGGNAHGMSGDAPAWRAELLRGRGAALAGSAHMVRRATWSWSAG